MSSSAVSKRYARALVDLAQKADRLEAVSQGLSQLASLAASHAELRVVVGHPGFSLEQRTAIFNELLERLELDAMLRPFVGLVIEKGRLAALSGIASAVESMTDEALGRVRARACTAQPMTAAQEAAVAAALEKRLGRQVMLETSVDPSLLAGLEVQVGSERFDGSVKGRLDRLGRQLLG